MTLWFTADLHVGHARIIELAYRPFGSVDEMNEQLIENWNMVVAPDDEVIVLGDVAMGQIKDSLPLVAELQGKKFLIPGNHDRLSLAYHNKREEKRLEWVEEYAKYFTILDPTTSRSLGEREVNLCHFPYYGDHTSEERYTEFRPKDDGKWLIHGHVHAEWRANGRQINVGVDVWNYAPVSEQILIRLIDQLEEDDEDSVKRKLTEMTAMTEELGLEY